MSALDKQVGGNHYKDFAIQPIEFIVKNNLGFIEGNVIKYICRWRKKNGLEDLEKAKHYVELLIYFAKEESNMKEYPDSMFNMRRIFYEESKEKAQREKVKSLKETSSQDGSKVLSKDPEWEELKQILLRIEEKIEKFCGRCRVCELFRQNQTSERFPKELQIWCSSCDGKMLPKMVDKKPVVVSEEK